MSGAVWMLMYDIASADRDVYIDWFHRVHIPEKLARPGYRWAAHYRAVDPPAGGADEKRHQARRYMAFFGGDSTRVFYDPSPSQLKLRQNEETRAMMGLRARGSAVVLCEEWGARGALGAQVLRLSCLDPAGGDEGLSAWLVQSRVADVEGAGGAVRKWLGSSGPPRHVVAETYDSLADCERAGNLTATDGAGEALAGAGESAGATRVGTRLWPPPEVAGAA